MNTTGSSQLYYKWVNKIMNMHELCGNTIGRFGRLDSLVTHVAKTRQFWCKKTTIERTKYPGLNGGILRVQVAAMIGVTENRQEEIIRREMSNEEKKKVYTLVLTGGPCGGKTTGQARLSTFFENLGWKVYRVPETATHLLGGGIKFSELDSDEAYEFQTNLLKAMKMTEETFFSLARSCKRNCLVICDRGTMDATAYLPPGAWERMKKENDWDDINLRDKRYDQVIHLQSAAKGAEKFYNHTNLTRSEDLDLARHLDDKTCQAWVGHPYFDVIDNSTGFEMKITKMIAAICERMGIDVGDRLKENSFKRKFLVSNLPDLQEFPSHEDFDVQHDYLVGATEGERTRLRKRGRGGNYTYMHTVSKPNVHNQRIQLRTPITSRQYQILVKQRDPSRCKIVKIRRCFLWHNQYYQMDIYREPPNERCKGLILLETYTTLHDEIKLPDFLEVSKEVTNDPDYSMFNLCKET